MKLMICGPQGCGKGTQAELLAKEFNLLKVSAGDLLREEKRKGTKLGKEIGDLIDKGNMVPANIIYELVLAKIKGKKDYIVDGFPRDMDQVKINKEIDFDKVIYLDVPEEVLLERLKGRLTCRNCGSVFHVKNMKPRVKGKCDNCNGELYVREDETEEGIKRRLELYNEKTKPVIEYYRKKGILARVDGSKDIQEVYRNIRKLYKFRNV